MKCLRNAYLANLDDSIPVEIHEPPFTHGVEGGKSPSVYALKIDGEREREREGERVRGRGTQRSVTYEKRRMSQYNVCMHAHMQMWKFVIQILGEEETPPPSILRFLVLVS